MSDTSVEPHKPHEKWSDDKKAECAIAVFACGSIEKAARQCHISPKTLGHWSRHDDRFNEALENLQGEKAIEHKHAYAQIVTKALKTAERGIDELDGKSLSAGDIKALVVTGATATDKGLLLDGKPTSIRSDSGSMEMLAHKFAYLAENSVWNDETKRYELRAIEGECEEIGR